MFAKDLAELSGRGTAATNLENWSIMESINLFLLVDMEIGPTRSTHKTSLVLIATLSKGSTCFKFTFSLCKHLVFADITN